MADNILMYKGKPLVRHGNVIYYGYMDEPYVTILQIQSTKEVNGEQMADKVTVQLLKTDPNITRLKDKIEKKAERIGLADALDVGSIWLERALAE